MKPHHQGEVLNYSDQKDLVAAVLATTRATAVVLVAVKGAISVAGAILARFGGVDLERPTIQFPGVQGADGFAGISLAAHGDESKALGSTSHPILDQIN